MKSKIRVAILFLIIANIIWGAAFPIYKLTLTDIPPFTFAFLRFFFSAIILFPFVFRMLKIRSKDFIFIILYSLIGTLATIVLLNLGLKLTSSINAPIILSSTPIFLLIGGFIFLKEKIKTKIVWGTLISFIGVLIIILLPFLDKGIGGSVTGNVFLFFAGLSSVVGSLVIKKFIGRYNPMTIIFWSFVISAISIFPFLVSELTTTSWMTGLNTQVLSGLLFAIIAATVIAHTINAFGVKYIAVNEIGIFSYVDPIATIIVAIPLLGEKISTPYVIGSFLVFFGIIVAEKRLNYHPLHKLLS